MAKRGDDRIKSATFFVSMLDFPEAGELGVFIDEEQLKALEEKMRTPRLSGRRRNGDHLQHAARQRPDLVVRGQQLSDGQRAVPVRSAVLEFGRTRMPAKMHSFYLRNMYQENLLAQPEAIELDGEKIDLGRITVPAYFLSTREDHIAPWRSTYRGTQLLGGPKRFVLAASATSPAWSIRRTAANTATGSMKPCRRKPGLARRRHRNGRQLVAGLEPLGQLRSHRNV